MLSRIKRIKYPALWITLAFFFLLELSLYIIPIEYGSSAGIFLTNHRKKLAEASTPVFDYIILGDSRSISLMGHAPSQREPYSVYNFSLPALGPRYFKYFMKKYLKNRKYKPAALIFSGEPKHFVNASLNPHHDPAMLYSKSTNDTLAEYLWNRFHLRIKYAIHGRPSNTNIASYSNEIKWTFFSHRYLHLFNIKELSEQFMGAERVFILRESAPLLIRIYKFRDAIKHHTTGFKISFLQKHHSPPICSTCEGTKLYSCYSDPPRFQDNQFLAAGINRRYGQLNITDRITPDLRAVARMFQKKGIENEKNALQTISPNLKGLENIIRFVTSQNIRMVLSETPHIDSYKNTKFYLLYERKVTDLLKKYPLATRIKFPQPHYPKELFTEHVHLECEGAEKLNRDFYKSVFPKILKFAPPDTAPERELIRGF